MPAARLNYNIDKFDYIQGELADDTQDPDTFITIGHNPSRTPKSVLIHNSLHLEILKTDIPYDEVTANKISKRPFQQRILDVPFDGVFVIRRAKRGRSRKYCKFECLKETTLENVFRYDSI